MFQVVEQLSNVRPPKSENPELTTTPNKGNMRLNSVAAAKIGVTNDSYVAILKARDENGEGLFIFKGNEGSEDKPQIGSRLASSTGHNGGSLLFSSENSYRNLGGNSQVNKVYEIGDSIEHDGVTYFRLNFVREEAKLARKSKNS
ncbi:MAG: hypothetical protein EKK61_03835 [Rickettsiales bacterium]|nr:MAG: hypothetical protein EKK61_03835 [Rickettsiales bacterium]